MRALISILLFAVMCGCVSRPQRSAELESVVRSGDCILVRFTDRSVPEARQVVDPTGEISLPLVGKLQVVGMTLEQIRQAVLAAYRPIERPLNVTVLKCP